ncbi:hypothetical protein LXL04_007931 [Taraxacum kok-saghyz]
MERDERVRDDAGWRTVARRRSKVETRKPSKEDELCRVVTTFFVSNLPNRWSSRRLWLAFERFGSLVDTFIPGKRDAKGRLFGFVRFIKVPDVNMLLCKFNDLKFEGFKILANVARHVRPKASTTQKEKYHLHTRRSSSNGGAIPSRAGRAPASGLSFKEALLGDKDGHDAAPVKETTGIHDIVLDQDTPASPRWLKNCLVGEVKNIELLSKCMTIIHAYGLGECSIRYVGGLSVLLQFNNQVIADCFLRNQKVNWSAWFTWLKAWDDSFMNGSKATWLKISGVPVSCWDSGMFSLIAGRFGRVLIPFDCPDDARDLSCGKVCILCPSLDPIGPVKVTVKLKERVFVALIKEEGDWKPSFFPFDESSDSDQDAEEEIGDLYEDADKHEIDFELGGVGAQVNGGPVSGETDSGKKEHELAHAQTSEIEHSCNDNDRNIGTTYERNLNWIEESEDATALEDHVECTLAVGPEESPEVEVGHSIGPLGTSQFTGPVEQILIPDLNTPVQEGGTDHPSKGARRRFNTIRLKDALISSNWRKKKPVPKEKEKRRMEERYSHNLLDEETGGQQEDAQPTCSDSSEELRKVLEVGDAIGYDLQGNESVVKLVLNGAGVPAGFQ